MPARSALSRLFGARSRAAARNAEPVPFRRTALFEALEPRLLLSADLAPQAESQLQDGLAQLQTWAQTVGTVGELAKDIPGVGTTIGQAIDLAGVLQSRIVAPVQAYLDFAGTQTTDGVIAALESVLGAGTVTGDRYGDEIRFDVVLDHTRQLADRPFALGATASGLALTAGADGTIDLQADLDLNFSFGVSLADGLAPEERFFIRVHDFKAGASANATLDFDLAVGFLGAHVTGGTFALNALLDVGIVNPDNDAQGNITLSELLGTTVEGLVDPTVVSGTLTGNLPVAVQALGSFDAGNAAVTLNAANIFTAPPVVAVTGTLAEDITNFGRVQPEAILQVLNQVAAWLNGLRSSDAFEAVIPLADSRTFGEVLRFAEGFTSGLIDQLKNADGVATFATAQAFAERLSTLLGLPPAAINAAYNTSTNQLTFFLRLQSAYAASTSPIEFDLNLAPLGGISTSSVLSIDASGTVQFVLGFDLSPFTAVLVADDVLPANGQLSQAATFQVSLDGGAYVGVTVPRDTTNTTRAHLVTDINAAFTAAGIVGLTASLDANRLKLVHAGGFTGAFVSILVPDVATNTAATELRLKAVNTAVDSLTKHAFLRDVRATGSVSAGANDIDASANFGFFGVAIENGTAQANATVDVQFRKNGNSATPMRFSDLFDGLDNIATWTSISSTGTLDVDLPIAVTGGLIALPGAPRVHVSMSNVFQPGTLAVTFPDLAPLMNYRELGFDDVLAAFGQLVTYLGTIDNFSFLNQDLPLIDRSVSDLVSFVTKFGDAKTALQNAGAQTIQQLEQKIEQAFGIAPSALTVSFANQSLEFRLNLAQNFADTLAIDLDLGQLAGFTNTDGTNLNGIGDLIDVGGTGQLTVQAGAALDLVFGFDLTNPLTPRAYIKDDSNIALTARVAGTDLDFDAALGPLGIFIRDGVVRLDNGAGTPASFTLTFNQVAGDRYYSNQWNTSALSATLVGSASATLPVYFPTVSNPVGGAGNNAIQLTIGNLANIAGTTTLTAPNLAAEIGSMDLFGNMGSFLDGIDLILATIQDALDGRVFGVNLPFVGDGLKDGAQFVEMLRTEILARLSVAFAGGQQSADQVRQILFDVFGAAGLDILRDSDDAGTAITLDDIVLTTLDPNNDGKIDDVKFRMKLGGGFAVTAPIAFDIGLPGLGLAIAEGSNVRLGLDYAFDLGLGVSRTDGVYLDTSIVDELSVGVSATLDDFAMGGTLGFLRVKVQDETDGDGDSQAPSILDVDFAIDLKDPVGSGNRLTFNELGSGNLNFAQVVTAKLNGNANINLDLTVGVPGDFEVTDPNAADFMSEQFPTLTADFNLTWNFLNDATLSGTLQNISFDNVRLNFGEFLSNFLGPVVDNITGIFDPLKPIIDAVTEPLPVISDVAGRDYTLLDLAADFGFIPQSTADFVEAVGDILDLADIISSTGGDGVFIDFGSFNLNGIDLRNAANASQLKGANVLNGRTTGPSTAIAQQLDSVASAFKSKKDEIKGNDAGGFRIPLLEDPASAFKLLLGQNVDLLTYTTPKFEFGFDFELEFGPVAVVLGVPIFVIFGGGASLEGQFTFGYDTQGIFDLAESGNAIDLFNGFFVADHDASGKDIDEMVLRSQIYAGAKADVFIAEIGAKGGVFADVFMNINDPNDDGKLRGRELFEVIQNGFLCAFDYRGEVGAFLSVFAEVGIWPFEVEFEWEIARVTLVSFEVDCDEPPPVLATLDEATGVLSLNMGSRSTQRVHGDLSDGDESFSVKQVGAGTVMVEAFGYSQLYGRFSNVDEETGELGPDVTKIIGWGGAGDDQITIKDNVDMPVELWGDFAAPNPLLDGDDILIASGSGGALLQGGGGVDKLYGGSGSDVIHGHRADGSTEDGAADIIYGRGGDDFLYGGAGDDQIEGEAGDDLVDGGDGADSIYGGDGVDTLRGGAGDDQIWGQLGNDILEGGIGTDALIGGADDDAIYGFSVTGAGDDNARDLLWGDFASGTDYERGGEQGSAGRDTLYGQGGNDDLFGEAGRDVLYGGTANDFLSGGADEDTIHGESGPDIISGGTANDLIFGGADGDTISGDQGNDLIWGETGDDTILGGADDDTILAGDGNDVVRGQEGDDQIFGEDGNDDLSGDLGDDVIVGGFGNDTAWGGAGRDRVYGSEGADQLFGGVGVDLLYGESGDDTLWGNAGDDFLDAGSGVDELHGGLGDDLLLGGTGLGKRLHGDEGDDRIIGADDGGEDADFLDAIWFGDRIYGGSGDDDISGLGGADWIEGGDGDDTIDGGTFGDQLLGQAGRDTIFGSFGNDRLFGGADDDTLDGGFGVDLIRGEAGNDELIGGGGAGDDLGGGDGEDILRGSNDGADVLDGDAGRDMLYGNGGNDLIRGGAGDDIADGGAGDDVIEGGTGSDVLLGGAQHDRLYGHTEAGTGDDASVDWLYGDFGTDLGEAGSGRDRLFGQGGNDILFGEGDDDFIDMGGGTSNIVVYGSGEVGAVGDYFAPIGTVAPTVVPSGADPSAAATLPAGLDVGGWWGEFSGSASGAGVSGGGGVALEPSVAAGLSDRYVAWADSRNGNFEIYVARQSGGTWSALGGSASFGGVSASLAQSRRPSLALDSGDPVVAWTEIQSNGASNIRVARWNGSAWASLGESLDADGISNSGAADDAKLLMTATGPVVVWTDRASGTAQAHAKRFDGTNWVALGGGGVALTNVAGGVSQVAATSDGTNVGVAWVQGTGDASEVHAIRFSGGVRVALGDVSNTAGPSLAPTLAFLDGVLFVAWQDQTSGREEIYVRRHDGGWVEAGAGAASLGGVSSTTGRAFAPQLTSGGGVLRLVWADDSVQERPDNTVAFYVKQWTGSAFGERLAGDASNRGVSPTGDAVQSIAVTTDAAGRPFIAWNDAGSGSPQVYLRGNLQAATRVFTADAANSVQSILDANTLGAGDVIVVAAGNHAGFTLTSADSGVTILGAPTQDSVFTSAVTIAAGAGGTLQRLGFVGGVNVNGAAGLTFVDNDVRTNALTVNGASGLRIAHNRFSNLAFLDLAGEASGLVAHNVLAGGILGLRIGAAFTGEIRENDIRNNSTGVRYNAAAELIANRIHDNTTGVQSTVDGASALGFVGAATPNEIFGNGTGIELVGARVRNQHVHDNTTGVRGSGVLGGDDLALANVIEGNVTGVSGFAGTVQFNRIAGNGTGIAATNGLAILHNLVYRNTTAGVLVSAATDVRIVSNTFYSPTGDMVRVTGGSSNVDVRGNVMWAESGYDLYVANDSQTGFFSDYNNLYKSGAGRIGYWTRDFVDVLDWQADIARFDLHSIGSTAVNPQWAEPRFANRGHDDFRLMPVTAGLRFTSPGVDDGDARTDLGVPPDYVNLLSNAGFENDLAGWNQFNINGTVVSSAPGAHQGSKYFRPGTIEEGYIEQVVDLVGPNVTAGDIDGQDLELVFGGRIRAAVETPRDRGAIEIRFLDADNAEMGAPVRVDATSTTDRWELVGGRIDIPTGARKAVYRFIADREQNSGTADAYLDGAFVYVRSEAQGTDLGAYGNTVADVARTGAPRIELRYPDLYADLEKDKPLTIRWETFGNAGESPVRIELWQDGANGPALRQTIAAATADDGEHIWIPSSSGLDFGTYGLRIQVSLVNAPIAIDRSQETFAVPEAGTTYWVDDASNANDEYTLGGTGDNRNTGKRADAPKPYATNLLRVYELNAASVLNIDTGSYSMIDPVAISGSTDLGLGLDEGFTLRGPSDVAKIADLFPAIPGNRTQPVILLDDADNMTISGLMLRNALRGLEVRNGSDGLALSYITVTGHAQDGMRVDTNAPFSTFHHLTAYANTGRGIHVDGPIAAFTHGLAYGNTTDGIVIDGAVGVVSDSEVRDNGAIGLSVSGPGAGARVEANVAYRNNVGIQVYNSSGGAEAIVGQMDLSLGRGNRVYENRQIGLQAAYNTRVAGNTIQNQTNTFSTGLNLFGGASASRNVVSGNYDGITFSGGGDVTENRVYDNDRYGISGSGAIDRNVVYSNATNINAGGSSVLRNNLVYASVDYGIFLSGDSAQILGNTVHSTSGHAIRIQGSASNTRVRNNIVSVSTGDGLSVAADSQSGFASDYNLFRTTGTGSVGMWQGVSRGSLVAWQNATFGDRNSLFGDPLFVDADGADGVLGYGGVGSDGRDDDFHERSQFGSFKGGALAPVRDGATGLPVFLASTLSLDDVTAPGIDRGAPADPFANEPANNGGYVNIGAYGNTAQASRSPAQYMLVTNPNGGEAIPQESTYDIRWRSAGFGGNVAIEYSVAAGAPVWQMLADDQANDGSYLWTVAPGSFAVADSYRIRVRSIDTPAIVDASNAAFSVTPPISIFYVNDGSTAGDQYTTAIGNDANDGLTAATPKATIRGVLEAYDLDAGDIIRVDNGSYLLTANIELVTQDSGVTIEGPTFDGLAAVLDRGNTSSTSFVFSMLGADDVTLRNLVIRGGYHGISAANAAGSDRLTVENSELIRNSQSGISIADGNVNALISDNEVYGNGSWGIVINGAGNRAVGNHVWSNGGGITASYNGQAARVEIIGNSVHDNSSTGIAVSYWVLVDGNRVYGNGSYGITLYDDRSLATNNEIYRNANGLVLSVGGVGRDNRVYANAGTGIELSGSGGGVAEGNVVYGNNIGITEGQSRVAGNLVYDNVSAGIVTSGYRGDGDGIIGNTVVQPTGDAIRVGGGAQNVLVRNNILEAGSGIAINVPSNSQDGFSSDYNLFRLGAGARIAFWEDRAFFTLADWFYETGRDGESLLADPLFIDTSGADGTRGYSAVLVGVPRLIDDGDAGFTIVGPWEQRIGRTNEAGPPAYTATALERTIYNTATGNDIHWIAGGGTGSNVARWSFDGLEDGTYQIAARWPTGSGLNSTTASYRVYDGDIDVADVVAVASLSQGNVPNDFTDGDGVAWERLETVEIRNGRLIVELSDVGGNTSSRLLADAVRIQRILGDQGADDDFHLAAGSVAVDRGDPTYRFEREPIGNGSRVDLGAYGNAADATQSPAQMVQVVNPNGLEKMEVGQSVVIDYRTAGLALTDPVLLMNAGSSSAAGYWNPQADVTGIGSPVRSTSIAAATAITTAGVTDVAPDAVYRTIAYADAGAGKGLRYQWQLPDGDYEVVLHFVEPNVNTVGQRKFDIALQGAVVQADVDVRALTGGMNRALALRFDAAAAGGQGLRLDLLGKVGSAMISGIEIRRPNPDGVAAPTVDLEVSVDGGGSWVAIAQDLAVDRFGRGSYTWAAGPQPGSALIRATAHAGAVTVTDVSDQPFQIANAGTAYYVNDASTTGDEFTTAIGDNANDGKTAATPMASLAALLRAYDLDPGDVIHVDTGVYALATNILLEAQDSGVTIRGPQVDGHAAVLNRGNTGESVIQFAGADDVTLERLAFTGGAYGVYGSASVDSDRITLDEVGVYGNSYGVSVNGDNDAFTIRDSEVYGNSNHGIQITTVRGRIENNLVRNNATGVSVSAPSLDEAQRVLVIGNEIRNNSTGISASNGVIVEENLVHHNTTGIAADQSPIVRRNTVHSNTGGGISVTNNASALDNRVFGNAGTGIYVRSGVASGNIVYDNSTGIENGNNSTVRGNLIYENTVRGVLMNGYNGTGDGLFGNTIYQSVGDGVLATGGGSNTSIRDNIIVVGAGYALRVGDDNQIGFASEYNLFHTFGTGKLAFWEGRDFLTLADWSFETANDFESAIANPAFVDIDGADGILGVVGGVDGGLDDDFRLMVGSPGVDAGDPASLFLAEPAANGGRVDLGVYGNTARATQSAAQMVQVLNPNGLEKFEAGQTVQVEVRSAGLTQYDSVMRLNTGNAGTPVDGWSVDRYRVGGSVTNSVTAISVAGVADAAPASIYQTWATAAYGAGNKLVYQLPAADGEYRLVIHTMSQTDAINAARFSITVDGYEVAASVDRRALAGANNKAVVLAYDVAASGGQGLTVEFTNITNNQAVLVAGIELQRVNAGGVANPTVDLEVSTDGGTSWIPVAGGVPLDRYGRGTFAWTAGPVAADALIRATGHAGAVTVTDVSNAPFQIANAGNAYYVNDGSLVGNEYTTAAGSNANDGKTAATPMASLAALLRAYDLDAGDVVYVDTGVYNLATNIVLTAQDSGVTIRGPVLPTHDAVLDRGNTNSDQRVFSFEGASGVTLEWLNLTGAQNGIEAVGTTGNDNVTLQHLDIYNNSTYGVRTSNGHSDWVIRENTIHNNLQYGLSISSERARIENNEVYGNNNRGIAVSAGTEASRSFVTGNDVHDNGSVGIDISSYVTARGNRVYNHNGAGDIGIYSYNSPSLVIDNDAWDNTIGIQTGYQGWIVGNRSFDNGTGIVTYYSSNISRNYVYSNSVGISDGGYSEIFGNLVYANTNVGIATTYSHSAGDRTIYDNTVWQGTGDAIRVSATSNIRIRNNILSVGNGYAINVAADGQSGFSSDWNLFDLRTAAALAGRWGATQRNTLADWRAVSANHDASGKTGDPKFLDIDGADNVLGDQDVLTGNGYDDNFSLDAGSAAIDAANAFEAAKPVPNYPHEAALRDIEDRQRHDDPSTANTGIGWDLFVESTPGGSSYAETGTAVPYRTSSGATTITLPFAFEFYGRTYNSVQASVNGFLHFAGLDSASGGDTNTLDELLRNVRIAPLWDNLRTDTTQSAASGSTVGNIFVDGTVANQVTIRWAATRQDTGGGDVNFSVTLFANGNIRFDYGDGNKSLTPTVGLSAGNGFTFVTSTYNGAATLENAASVLFTPTEGLAYFDIGAYEFLGNSGDAVAPTVDAVSILPPNNGTTALAFSSVQVTMSEALNSISAKSPANYDLRRAGADGQFDTVDDVIIALRPAYSYPETALTLDFLTGPGGTPGILSDGAYRLVLSGTKAIYDLSGNPLDGNADGTGGDDYVRFFTIDRTTNAAPVANDQSRNVDEDGSIVVTLSATDGNGDALTYSLVTAPTHGTLTDFDPVARTVRYTPTTGYTGPDAFTFQVDDGKAGVDTGTISLSVLPVNDAPLAANQAVTLEEDTPRLIVLGGADTETGRADLVFTLVTAPTAGALSFGPAGGWTYTPGANYVGTDSFTYTVTDRGDPDGTPANALTSAPATVSLVITAVNDAPVIGTVDDQVVLEGSTLLVDLSATDPEGHVLVWTLDAAPAGMSIDANTGVVNWTPADGVDVVNITARATDAGSPAAFDTVSFQVTVQNVVPTLVLSGAANVDQGAPFTLNLAASDPGADTIASWDINWGDGFTQTVAGGTTSVDHVYFAGGASYAITATATDEDGTYAAAPIDVFVVAPNTAPVPQSQTVFVDEDGSVVITLGGSDADGDALSFAIETGPLRGTLSAIDPATRRVTFTPAANVRGNDSFTFRVSDGEASAVGTVSLKVRPVNDVPVADDASFDAIEDTALSGQLGGSDVETPAGALVYSRGTGPLHGVLVLNADGSFTYTPDANFAGTDTFTFAVTDTGDDELDCGCPLEPSGFVADGPDTSTFATVTITVAPRNDAPVAQDDTHVGGQGETLVVSAAQGVLANDGDIDGGPLTVTAFDAVSAQGGTVIVAADGGFTYTPRAGYSGTDSFRYTVNDGAGGSDEGLVTIDVQARTLRVTGITQGTSGVNVRFNRAIDPSVLNLYDASNAFGPADLALRGAATGAVRGSMVVDADGLGVTFVKTGTVLAADSYTLTLRGAGVRDTAAGLLDGNGDGVTGDDASFGFVVAPSTDRILSMGDFTRGPGQDVVVPNNIAGGLHLPLRLSDGAGAKRLVFDLAFDAALLQLQSVQLASGITGVVTRTAITGGERIEVVFDALLAAGAVTPLDLVTHVPAGATYGASQVLDLRNVQLRDAADQAIGVQGDDAVHQVGYFMDADGDRAYTMADVQKLQRVIVGNDSGFAAYRNTDPLVIADFTGDGRLNSLDANRFQSFVNGMPRAEMPAIPVPAPAPMVATMSVSEPVSSPAAAPAAPAPAATARNVPSAPAPVAPVAVAETSRASLVNWDANLSSVPLVASPATPPAPIASWSDASWAKDLGRRIGQLPVPPAPAGTGLLRTLASKIVR